MLAVSIVLLVAVSMGNAQTILMQERCTDGALENTWSAGFNGNALEAVQYPGNPSGDAWVGRLANHVSGGNVGQTWAGSPDWQDYYYEAQVYIPIGEGVYHGLEFRVDTTGLTSGYQFVARFTPGGMISPRLRFRVRPSGNPGMPTAIRDWEASEIPGGIPTESGWHKMAVHMKGHNFRFWFDGNELPGSPVMDFTSLKGVVGAYVWDSSSPMITLHIDDINVSTDVLTSVASPVAHASQPSLQQNFPNPVHYGTNVSYVLPAEMHVRLEVYDMQGRHVATLTEGTREAGRHVTSWNAARQPAGTYLMRLYTERGLDEIRTVVLR